MIPITNIRSAYRAHLNRNAQFIADFRFLQQNDVSINLSINQSISRFIARLLYRSKWYAWNQLCFFISVVISLTMIIQSLSQARKPLPPLPPTQPFVNFLPYFVSQYFIRIFSPMHITWCHVHYTTWNLSFYQRVINQKN